jgi:hypothetical protein
MTNHITPPATLDSGDPRCKGPSHEALVRAWPIILRQVTIARARLARETREREGRMA